MGKEFLPSNLLETTLGVQETIDLSPPELQDKLGNDFAGFWRDAALYYGAYKVEIHGQVAYGLADGLTREAEIMPLVRYRQPRVRAMLADVMYARINSEPSILWMVVNPYFRDLADPFDMMAAENFSADLDAIPCIETDVTQRRPIYFPVRMIESVLVAA